MAMPSISRVLKLFQLTFINSSSISHAKTDLHIKSFGCNLLQCKALSCSSRLGTGSTTEEKKPRKKTIEISKITLIQPDGSMTITELASAQKLCKRRNFQLERLNVDPKTGRVVYKMLGTASVAEEDKDSKPDFPQKDNKKKTNFKSTKIVTIHSNIADNDLLIKVKNINRILMKNRKVKVVVTQADDRKDSIVEIIKTKTKSNGVVQNTLQKNQSTILIIQPLQKTENDLKPEESQAE